MRYTQIVSCGLMALVLASSTALTQAQTVPAVSPVSVKTSGTAEGEVLIKENLFTVSPALETELSADSAVPVQLQFNAQPNTAEAVDISGITAEGFTRKVSVNGEEIAQVVVTRLKKDTEFVDLEADKFTSQFGVESNRLLPTTAISVDGDEAEFVQAVARLSGTEEAREPEEELEDKENTVEDDTSVDEAGGGEGENPVAGGYETPERLEQEEEEEREPNVTYNVTTDGCEPEIDLVSGVVRQTSLSQTLEDGVVTETDACAPNGVVFPIQKNYEACEDIVDRDSLVATPQYASFYNDDRGARFDLAACQPDASMFYGINEDFDACSPDLDFSAEEVTMLSQFSYRGRGGKKVIVSECEPSEKVFQMEREYGVCGDFIDLKSGVAQAQYSLFYVDGKASRHKVSECLPDADKSFEIVEKQNCTFDFDLDNGRAIVNTSLLYTNDDGVELSVRECAPSQTIEPIQMRAEPNGCSMQHDFGAGVSTEMAMWTYEHEGQLFQASPCITTDTVYTHERVFDKNGIDVCSPIVDLANGQAVRQYRTEINVNGGAEIIAGCQPDEANMIGIYSTVNGCDDPASFDHDLAAGVSYGLERYYYDVAGRERTYVTACQKNDQTFTHSVSPNGWKYIDSELRAQQLVDVSINVNGKTFAIATSYLQPGTSEIAYSFVRNQDNPDYSAKYYNGCTEMVPTRRSKIYTRPDGSSYSKPSGNGTTINNGDKCTRTVQTRKLNNMKINLAVKGYSATVRDGSGKTFAVSNGCGSGGKTYSGKGPYSLVGQSGPAAGCNHPSNKVIYYHQNDERTKVTYPTGNVTYSSWKTVSWSTTVTGS
ncbi:hypothetical protein [Roseibium marinum]|uniref:Uncharacterized protein n=1 Tax=Roseibium marinum TaxID=281252 RepID=A0A2S3UJI9_9HYPH|nr:hypothetical protein [Roseibium marinum]POF27821.1 hypothetical protein CLV41_12147 [Roseibium marinum]